jgi:predicted Zn-ribbon and HTH transcriptional regulator
MCVACLPEPVRLRQAVATADDFESRSDELLDAVRRHNATLTHPWPTCPTCGFLFHPSDRGSVRTDRCDTCSNRWLDRIVRRLIRRHGRKGAVKALKRLVK